MFDDQPTTEHDVVEITDNTIVDQLEITTQHRTQTKTRVNQQRAETLALDLIEHQQF
jgi:hypothetical protein